MADGLVLRVVSGPDVGRMIGLSDTVTLGRGDDATLVLQDRAVSRRHALIAPLDNGFRVVDLASSTGTRVDGRRLKEPVDAAIGSTIHIGETVLMPLRLVAAARRSGAPWVEVFDPEGLLVAEVPIVGDLVVGRGAGADILVDDPSVSRRHASLSTGSQGVRVTDFGSANGTRVNGQRLVGERVLAPGDAVGVGTRGTTLVLRAAQQDAASTRQFRLRAEGSTQEWSVSIGAPATTTVADVARACAGHLGLPSGSEWFVYSERGLLWRPDEMWSVAGLARGECLVLASGGEALPQVHAGTARAEHLVVTTTPPRSSVGPADVTLPTPRVPEGASLKGRGTLWQIAGGLVVVVGAIAVAMRYPGAALFAVIGAVAGLGSIGFGLLGEQSRRRHGVREFREALARLCLDTERAYSLNKERMRDVSPDVEVLNAWAGRGDPRLWERRPTDGDFLRLRFGIGSRASGVRAERTEAGRTGPLVAELDEVFSRHSAIPDVPVLTPAGGIIGICGPRAAATALAARMVVEASCLHAPAHLGLWVLDLGTDWSWTRWLPHLAGGRALGQGAPAVEAGARDLLASRPATTGIQERPRVGRRSLVVCGPGTIESASVRAVLHEWTPDHGLALVIADAEDQLPPECDAVLALRSEGTVDVRGSWVDAPLGAVRAELSSTSQLAEVARALAPLHDPRTPDPTSAGAKSALDLSGVAGPEDVERHWRTATSALRTTFGSGPGGDSVSVDLRLDGPHGVVAGTTGSGKSELLLSFVAGLVATVPPTRLNLFLIDYKGGATFGRLASLPHVVGMVSDLEGSTRLAQRAFATIEAEIARRKAILARHGVGDLPTYERLPGPTEPLPSLLVLIDEFALLVTSIPSVKARLDLVAAQGRSLGVHLLLATQSPQGVITPAIRANTNMWICLRVVQEHESQELLGSREAAHLPVHAPGQGFVRRGGELALSRVAVARITAAHTAGGRVEITPFHDSAPVSSPVAASVGSERSDLDLLVEWAESAAMALALPTSVPLWTPPLTKHLPWADAVAAGVSPDGASRAGRGSLPARLGVVDDPARQVQFGWDVDLGAANLLVCGRSGSGRTTALRAVARSLVERSGPDAVHLYAVDGTGDLADLAVLPQVAGVVRVDDEELLTRLVDRLVGVIESRRRGGGRQPRDPSIVLLIDDHAALRDVANDLRGGRFLEQVAAIITSGPALGVHTVLAASAPTELRMTLLSGFGHRILLAQEDAGNYASLDVRPSGDDLPDPLPGRGLIRSGHEVHVADPGALDTWHPVRPPAVVDPRSLPVVLRPLPERVTPADLPGSRLGAHGIIGLGGADIDPVVLPPPLASTIVLGEMGSGRSTALLTVTLAAVEATPDVVLAILGPRPGPLDGLAEHPSCVGLIRDPAELADLLDRLEARAGIRVLVLDDADLLKIPAMVADRLEGLLRTGRDTGFHVLLAARAVDWLRAFDGWARYLTSLRRMVLLAPTLETLQSLGVRSPAVHVPMVRGRGFVLNGQDLTLVQVTDGRFERSR